MYQAIGENFDDVIITSITIGIISMMMLINNLINDIVVLMTLHRCFDCAQTYQCTQPCLFKFIFKHLSRIHIPRGLTARIAGFHPAGPGSTPGVGKIIFYISLFIFQ